LAGGTRAHKVPFVALLINGIQQDVGEPTGAQHVACVKPIYNTHIYIYIYTRSESPPKADLGPHGPPPCVPWDPTGPRPGAWDLSWGPRTWEGCGGLPARNPSPFLQYK